MKNEYLIGVSAFLALASIFTALSVSAARETEAREKTKQEYIKKGYYECHSPERGEYWSPTPCKP